MHPLSAWELLDIWEQGLVQPPVQRALLLLAAANPDTPWDQLVELSVGARDARLLTLREWTFGPHLVSLATCPRCGEWLELPFRVSDIRTEPGAEPGEALVVRDAEYEVRFRLPNSRDLAALVDRTETEQTDVETIHHALIERCLLTAHQDGHELTVAELPTPVIDAMVEQMAQADPQADVRLNLTCPACGHQWRATFDIVSFFWTEINTWAQRTLQEIHTLASAYGWREADILAMSAQRRRLYLQMVGG